MLEIRKKGVKNFEHVYNSYKLTFSDLRIAFNGTTQNVLITRENGAFVIKREGFNVTEVSVYDETGAGTEETFVNVNTLANRLIELGYIAFYEDGDIVPSELISSDASNDLSIGTDGLLFVPPAGAATNGLPIGGTTGQILKKQSATDFNADWEDESAGAVMESDYNANTILSANTDDTPTAITIAESQILGRLTGGNIKGLSVAEIKTLLGITGIRPRATIVATGVSGTYNIDFALSIEFRIVMTGATTITFSNYDKALGETTGIYFTGAVPVLPGTVNEVPGSETPDAAKRNYAVLNVFDAGSGTEVVDFMNKIMTT